MTNSW